MKAVAFTCLAAVILCVQVPAASAQLSSLSIKVGSSDSSHQPVSAAEARYHVILKEAKLKTVSLTSDSYSADSTYKNLVLSGAYWLNKSRSPSNGIQVEPAVKVGTVAGDEKYVEAHLATRLSEPGLSFADKAFSYATAVQALADAYYPNRLPLAENYLKQLDAMGDSAARWQFQARSALVDVYYQLGKTQDVIRHGVKALELVNVMPFVDRQPLMYPFGANLYAATVDALSGQANGAKQIESLNNSLKKSVIPPPALVAFDSQFVRSGQYMSSELRQYMSALTLLGTKGHDIISNYWLNLPTTDSANIPVVTGKIHVLVFGSYTCPPCMEALAGMQRIQKSVPGVQPIFVTWTTGFWGNRLLEPDEEVLKLSDVFLNTVKAKVPIAIWKGKKVVNEDGGLTPETLGPNVDNYPLSGKPTIWILDGKGIIRRVFLGYSRDREEVQIVKTVHFLEREAQGYSSSAASF